MSNILQEILFSKNPGGSNHCVGYWQIKKERYFHVGTCHFDKRHSKLSIPDVTGLCFLWLDLDFKKPGKPAKYAPDLETALNVVYSGEYRPSVIVNSGGGLHVYWLFDEFVEINDENRNLWQGVSESFQAYWAAVLRSKGYDCDKTADLSRILRVFGDDETPVLNGNYDPPRPVKILENLPEIRYSPDTLIEHFHLEPGSKAPVSSTGTEKAVPRAVRTGLEATFENLLKESDRFRETWNKQAKFPDQSGSAYALSLATQMYLFGLEDAEIKEKIIEFLAIHDFSNSLGKIEKSEKWWIRTLDKAKKLSIKEKASEDAREIAEKARASESLDDILTIIEETTWIAFTGIEKLIMGEEIQYKFIPKTGSAIKFADFSDVLNYKRWRSEVFEATGKSPVLGVPELAWNIILEGVLRWITVVEIQEARPVEEIRRFCRAILRDANGERDISIVNGTHFTDDMEKILYVSLPELHRACVEAKNLVTTNWLRANLHAAGAENVVQFTRGGRGESRVSRRYWKIEFKKFEVTE